MLVVGRVARVDLGAPTPGEQRRERLVEERCVGRTRLQRSCLLEELAADSRLLARIDDDTRLRLVRAAGPLARPDRYMRKALAKQLHRQKVRAVRSADQAVLDQTGIRSLRKEPVFRTPLPKPAQALDAPVRDDGEPDDGGWAAPTATSICSSSGSCQGSSSSIWAPVWASFGTAR